MVVGIDQEQMFHAIKAVKKLNKHHVDSCKTKPLFDEPAQASLLLQISLKKIPSLKNIKMIKVLLPHPLHKDASEVCLIAGDLDKRNRKAEIEPDILHYKELLKSKGVTQVNEVITLRQLRTEYKDFEAKRQLLAAYDVFLADSKIVACLPRLLGKFFFKKRKFPIQICMEGKLQEQVKNALSKTVFYLSSYGSSCTSEVANLSLPAKHIQSNINAVLGVLEKELPGGWGNIAGLYLRTAKSKSIPIYVSYESSNDVTFKVKKEEVEMEAEELSTRPSLKVKVFPSGSIKLCKDAKK